MLGIDHIVYGGVWWFFNISIAYCVYRVKSPSLRLGKTPGRQAAVPRRMDAARRGFFGCRWSGQHFNLLDWNLINQAKHVIMSKQAAQRKLSDFSGKWTRFQICIAGKVQKAWQVPDDGEELQEEVGLLRDWDGWVSRPQVAPLTSHQNRYWWTWFSFHFPAIGVQQTLLFCVKGDFGKKHAVLKAIRKPSSFAEQMWCFFFFWEHLFPQAPPEPEEDGLDDEQREVDMEKEWTCGYWRYRSVDLRFLCRALDSELSSEKVPPSFSLHFQEIKRRRSLYAAETP